MNKQLLSFLAKLSLLCATAGVVTQVVFANRATLQPGTLVPYPPPQDKAIVTSPPYPPPQNSTATPQLPPPPKPTNIPSPIPEISPAIPLITDYFTTKFGIPASSIAVVTDHVAEYPNLERKFHVVTILDMRPEGKFYNVLVDLSTKEVIENVNSIWIAEHQARTKKYGKLQADLYLRLQTMKGDEKIMVTIWLAVPDGQTLSDKETSITTLLASKYPEAQIAIERGGKPMDVDDPKLAAQIYTEYVSLLEGDITQNNQPLIKELEARGIDAYATQGLPAVTALVSKDDVLALMQRDDIATIYLAEAGHRHHTLNSAVTTNLAPSVWARGYDGTGVDIAILEDDNVDFTSDTADCPPGTNNCFLHPGLTQMGMVGEHWHASLVASSAASNHSLQKGMAYGATIMSAGITGALRQDDITALVWALNNGAEIVNASYGWCPPNDQMDSVDRAFDQYARSRFRLITVAAGNIDADCSYNYVDSPAKAWNVLSVGAYDDYNNSDWSDDEMATFSSWDNPSSINSDREKPEVVAPGVSITGIEIDGWLGPGGDGTSFSAPQVAGLAALLIDRDSSLSTWPEASRAIIMASATHNITGPTGIPTGQDLRDGAGGINATLADLIAATHNLSSTAACGNSCWWGNSINNTSFPVGTYTYRYFTATKGDFIRVSIAWWSNASCTSISNCNYDRLDTDLNLGAKDPDGEWIPGAWSASWDNNYELIEFVAPKTGTYRIAVYKARADETSNYLGIALLKLKRLYLPLIMK
jgi:subtilisin family serine protease